MIINGPFNPGVDYGGVITEYMTTDNHTFEIEINEPNLHRYKYLRFLFKQDLHRFHTGTIFVYMRVGNYSELLPVKRTPTQCYGFIEYRVRLTSALFTGTSGMTLLFNYPGVGGAELEVKELRFGPASDDEDVVLLPTGVTLQVNGGGITSPNVGYIPMAVGEIVDVVLYPYFGAKVKKVEFNGSVYDENGKKYPGMCNPGMTFKIQYLNPFENCQIIVTFGEI